MTRLYCSLGLNLSSRTWSQTPVHLLKGRPFTPDILDSITDLTNARFIGLLFALKLEANR